MLTSFCNGHILSRSFEDGHARIRATEIGRRAGPIRPGIFAALCVATCERFGDSSKPIVVPPTGASGYETGLWLRETQIYSTLTAPGGNPRAADVLLRQVICAFVDLRSGRVTSELGEPVTPAFNPGDGDSLNEFDALYMACRATEAELPPNKPRNVVIEETVKIFDELRRAPKGRRANSPS